MLNIGVIGCGHWGKNYVRVFGEIKGVNVVVCSDLIRSNLDTVKDRYPYIDTTEDYTDIISNPDIEAVVISTPATSHFEIAAEALKADKHIMVEKPLATTVKDCLDMISIADAKERVLMVGHTFIYNDSVRKMKELVQHRNMGDIYYLHACRSHLGTIREDVSVMWDLAPHDISIFSYIMEMEPEAVSAVGGSYLKEGRYDVAFITLFYKGGAIGNIKVSWVDSNKVREVAVIGSKCRVLFDDLNPLESVRIFEKGISYDKDVESYGEFKYLLRDGDILSPKVEHREPLKNLCLHFVECVREGKRPLTGGEEGTNIVKVLIAVHESMEKKGAVVEIR